MSKSDNTLTNEDTALNSTSPPAPDDSVVIFHPDPGYSFIAAVALFANYRHSKETRKWAGL